MYVKVDFEKSVMVKINKDIIKEMIDNEEYTVDLTNYFSVRGWLMDNLEWDNTDEEFEEVTDVRFDETEFQKLVNEIKENIQQ